MAFSNAPQYSTYQQKRIQFYGDTSSRAVRYTDDYDQIFENVYCESDINPQTGEKRLNLCRRPGLRFESNLPGGGTIRGSIVWERTIYFVKGVTLYKWVSGAYTALGDIGTSSGTVGLCITPYEGDSGLLYLIVSDGIGLWTLKLDDDTFSAFPAGYPTPHVPMPVAMDGYVVLAKAGTDEIWNSQLSDWSLGWDFISSEMYPDILKGLSRYNNYIMALGTESIEMFYNAAFETGSPFARNESVVITVGCVSPLTAVQTDRSFFWVGTTQEGNRSIWHMVDFKAQEIGTEYINRWLSGVENPSALSAVSVRAAGRHWYVVYLPTVTFAYDINEKKWAVWKMGSSDDAFHPKHVCDTQDWGVPYMMSSTQLLRFTLEEPTDLGAPIRCRWQTEVYDMDTMNRKFLHRITMVGNTNTIGSINMYYTDDDYQTWTGPRAFPMSSSRPAIVNLGYFRQRAFRFEYTEAPLLRVQAVELTFNVGVN